MMPFDAAYDELPRNEMEYEAHKNPTTSSSFILRDEGIGAQLAGGRLVFRFHQPRLSLPHLPHRHLYFSPSCSNEDFSLEAHSSHRDSHV